MQCLSGVFVIFIVNGMSYFFFEIYVRYIFGVCSVVIVVN